MAVSGHLILCSLAFLTVLASIVEIVLASRVLHYLSTLHDQVNYAYNGVEESGANPVIPLNEAPTFEQPWVLVQSGLIWAVPRTELAAGTIAFALGLLLCIYFLGKIWFSRKSGSRYVVQDFGANGWIATVLLPILALAITGLFIYVFAVSGYSASNANLSLGGTLGGTSWDATPTWEVWTCAMSSFLDKDSSFPAARSEWNTICRLTVSSHVLPLLQLTTNDVKFNHRQVRDGLCCLSLSLRYFRYAHFRSSSGARQPKPVLHLESQPKPFLHLES